MANHVPESVLAHWSAFRGQPSVRVGSGLINDTYLVEPPGRPKAIVQRLHPVFDASVNLDIAAVTGRLRDRGLETPALIETDNGALSALHEERVWRALSFVPGHTHDKVCDDQIAFQAGVLVGRFHAALTDFDYRYRHVRANIHDTEAHLARLRAALQDQTAHPLHGEVRELARPVLTTAAAHGDLADLPLRHAHGDLKISNILFDDTGHAVCLIDLDTLGRMGWVLEMGDALRSWCNPRREDQQPARLELGLMDAALAGYAGSARDIVRRDERERLVSGVARICLELAARFLTDALVETYFGWDESRYPSRGHHNVARGRAMWALHESVTAQRSQAERIVQQRLG